MCLLHYVDSLTFNQSKYEVTEDKGSLCINLTLDKPALLDVTVAVESKVNSSANSSATSKLYNYIIIIYMYTISILIF